MHVCPKSDIVQCLCEHEEMMHGPNASLYPSLGFFRTGRRLLHVASCRVGGHFWHAVVNTPSSFSGMTIAPDKDLKVYHLIIDFYMDGGRGLAYSRIPLVLRNATPIVHLWRIQRVVRKFLLRRFQQRGLALMMGTHGRLGDQCLLNCLPDDVVRCHFGVL